MDKTNIAIIKGDNNVLSRAVIRFYYDHENLNILDNETLITVMEAISIGVTTGFKRSRSIAESLQIVGTVRYTPKASLPGSVSVLKVKSLPSDELVIVLINDHENKTLASLQTEFSDRCLALLYEAKNEQVDEMLYAATNPGITRLSIHAFQNNVCDLINATLFTKLDGSETPIIKLLNEYTTY